MMNLKVISLIAAILLFFVANLTAQSTGEVTGTVTDPGSAVVPNAELQLVNEATKTTLSSVSNDDGLYRFAGLQPGIYTLIIRAAGFAETRVAGVAVEVNRISRNDVSLQVAGATTQVNIDAGAQLLDLDSGTKGTTIQLKQARDLPLQTRNPLALTFLTPGVTTTNGSTGATGTGNRQGSDGTAASANYTVNGGTRRATFGGFNELVVDGISITNQRDGTIVALPTTDSLREFRIQSGGISAEFGRTVGGVISYATDSGTNDFHGNLFESVRNTALNARRALPAVGDKPITQFNQFGGTVGGPVFLPRFGEGGPYFYDGRNKTFFFFGYEGSRFIRNNPTISTVPTLRMRNGDFSEVGNIIYDPASSTVAANRTAFAGNIIPAGRINPIGKRIIDRFPLPNLPGVTNNYAGFFRASTPVDNYTFRVDQTIKDVHRIFFRLTRVDSINDAIFNLGDADAQTAISTLPQRSYVVNYNFTISPTFLYTAAAGYTTFKRTLNDPSGNTDGGGFFGFSVTPVPRDVVNVRPIASSDLYRPIGTRDIFDQVGDSYQLNQSLTYIRGQQTFRFGTDLRRYIAAGQLTTGATNGSFGFASAQTSRGTATTGYAAASLLLGLANTATFSQPPRLRAQKNALAFYVQDDFRVSSKLTLNLGLRYDIEGAVREAGNQVGYFDSTVNNSIVNRPGTFRYAGINGEETIVKGDYNNLYPRLGFAYALDKDGKTALRGAFAMYAAPIPTVGYYSAAVGFEPTLDFTRANAQAPALVLGGSYALSTASGPLGDRAYLGQSFTQPLNRNLQTPRVTQWNIGVQRELARNTVVDVLYTGNQGRGLLISRNINLPPQSLIDQAINLTTSTGNPTAASTFLNAQVANPLAGLVPGTLGNATIARAQAAAPFPQFGAINVYTNEGKSAYHALQATLQKRLSNNLNFTVAYTFSKLIETTDGALQNPYDLSDIRAVSSYDRPHIFSASATYHLPFGKGRQFFQNGVLNYILGGFQLTGIFLANAGAPLAVTQSAINGLGIGSARPDVITDPVEASKNVRGTTAANGNVIWIDPAAYRVVNGRFGTAPVRDARLREPSFYQLDLGLQRDFAFTERVVLRLRAEAFNALNKTNLLGPDTNLNSPTFGQISAVQDPRIFQLGFELRF